MKILESSDRKSEVLSNMHSPAWKGQEMLRSPSEENCHQKENQEFEPAAETLRHDFKWIKLILTCKHIWGCLSTVAVL